MHESFSGYWVVILKRPLPGIRAESFVFTSENEAFEFASCIHAKYENAETQTEPAGTAESIFPGWSF